MVESANSNTHEQQATTESNTAVHVPNETISLIERAEKLNRETKEAEERIKEHRKVIEEIETKRIMGGFSNAGSNIKTPEELKKDEAQTLADQIVGAFKRR